MNDKAKRSICDINKDAYKHWTAITLRYGDTDRQGHINNAVYCTLFESGRVGFLFDGAESIAGDGTSYVIAKLSLDYLVQMHFPGTVEVGSKILRLGNSSFVVGQGVFLNDVCCSTAESIIVLLDDKSAKPIQLSAALREKLNSLI